MNAIAVVLFLGGGNFPGIDTLVAAVKTSNGDTIAYAVQGLLTLGAFLLKTTALSFLSVWVRASVPRVRYDQLMHLGWKILLPMGLFNVVMTAIFGVLFPTDSVIAKVVMGVVGLLVVVIVSAIATPKHAKRGVTLVNTSAGN
jgi:NADH-quinone oxidoreductase subunit H